MDDQQRTEKPQSTRRAIRNPRSVRPPAATKKRSLTKTEVDPAKQAVTPSQDSPESENSKKSSKKGKSFVEKARDFIISSLVLLVVAGLLEFVTGWSESGKVKLQNADAEVIQSLNSLQPSEIAGNFYTRLTQQHGFVIYQWDAPFNAQVAKYRLEGLDDQGNAIAKPDSTNDFTVNTLTEPNAVSAGQAMAEAPLGTQAPSAASSPSTYGPLDTGELTHIQQIEQNEAVPQAESQGEAKIDRTVFLKGVGLVTIIIALPDAYMYMIRQLLPHDSLIVAACLASLVFFIARAVWMKLDEKRDGWGLVMALIYLPLVVSLTEWMVQKMGLGAAHALSSLLSAPALAVTGSLGLTPALTWATGKLTEHHLYEFAHASVRHAVVKNVSDE